MKVIVTQKEYDELFGVTIGIKRYLVPPNVLQCAKCLGVANPNFRRIKGEIIFEDHCDCEEKG